MSRISSKFAELKSKHQGALITYVMSGYPDESATISAVRGLVKGGADIIELGFPFSDPLADGPVIQNAATVSLNHGTDTGKFFRTVRKIRKITDIPLVLMTYANVPYRRGYAEFVSEAHDAGIDGMILPDMPVEESKEYAESARGVMDTIFLASPNTSGSRMRQIASASSGFMYLVAVYGTTGTRAEITNHTLNALRRAKRHARIPIGVGFGVSTAADVKEYVQAGADAVIVGSALLSIMDRAPRARLESRIATFARSLKKETILE